MSHKTSKARKSALKLRILSTIFLLFVHCSYIFLLNFSSHLILLTILTPARIYLLFLSKFSLQVTVSLCEILICLDVLLLEQEFKCCIHGL